MPKAKKVRKFAAVKRVMSSKEAKKRSPQSEPAAPKKDAELVKEIPQVSSALFFQYNRSLTPPYQVLIDTNFINFSIRKKIDLFRGLMDSLYAKCIPIITDCVMAELEKLGPRYRIALRIARDEKIERLKCTHKGTYADDCIVQRIMQHKCYIVATNDADLKRRIRKVPGVPILSVGSHAYVVERLPEVF
ncbi:Fcf1-domain-containing protein [Limtongia smithiae]|uniref:Fcf1-domain-containing protein n=1 Tax=Limtongia smithiae TaxID=1125753 RepID=UPI0034CFF9F6